MPNARVVSMRIAAVTRPTIVWTATAPNGELAPDTLTCKGWTSLQAADKGNMGISGVDKMQQQVWIDGDHWTSYFAFSCVNIYRIYCFEQ